jgi:hypothetical protein
MIEAEWEQAAFKVVFPGKPTHPFFYRGIVALPLDEKRRTNVILILSFLDSYRPKG